MQGVWYSVRASATDRFVASLPAVFDLLSAELIVDSTLMGFGRFYSFAPFGLRLLMTATAKYPTMESPVMSAK